MRPEDLGMQAGDVQGEAFDGAVHDRGNSQAVAEGRGQSERGAMNADESYASECELCHERQEENAKPSANLSSWQEDDGLILFWTICPLCRAKLIGNAATITAIAPVGTVDQIRSAIKDMRSTLRECSQ